MSFKNPDSRELARRCKKTFTSPAKLKTMFVESVRDDFIESSKTTIDGFTKSPDVASMKQIKTSKEYGSIVASFFGENDRVEVDNTIFKLNMAEENYKKKSRHLPGDFFSMPGPASSSFDNYYCEDDEEEQAEFVMMFDKLSTDESE
jgi:hypothetical protein